MVSSILLYILVIAWLNKNNDVDDVGVGVGVGDFVESDFDGVVVGVDDSFFLKILSSGCCRILFGNCNLQYLLMLLFLLLVFSLLYPLLLGRLLFGCNFPDNFLYVVIFVASE